MARLSSVSNRLETIGRMPRDTAWKMTCASAGDLTRSVLQVGRCILEEIGSDEIKLKGGVDGSVDL